jgi:predicted metal-dependent phosphoesterase TrpH
MGIYLYDTHVHTSEASACATGSGAEMVRAFASLGYSGIIVTDHFFNGNTAIPAWLPWEARVERFCRGYENALEEGRKIGLDVFFGWEYTFFGTDFLTYGLDKEFLFDHPDILKWPLRQYLKTVRESGGFISHAHPFRQAFYISEIRLFPDEVDAVEVYNASHVNPGFNEQALAYAKKHGLLQTSGSDAHHEDMIMGGGMAFSNRLSSINDFISTVRSGEGYRLLGDEG